MDEARIAEFIRSLTSSYSWESQLVEELFPDPAAVPSDHDVYHSIRVKRMAFRLSSELPADREVLAAASFLHDIASDQDRLKHVTLGIQRAKETLPTLDFPAGKIELVLRVIEAHEDYDWSKNQASAELLVPEVSVFQDADRLDAIGAIGIGRVFTFGGVRGIPMWLPGLRLTEAYDSRQLSRSSISHLQEKILKLEKVLNTKLGRQIARRRSSYVRRFVHEFLMEWDGKD